MIYSSYQIRQTSDAREPFRADETSDNEQRAIATVIAQSTNPYQPKWPAEVKRLRREAAIIGENVASLIATENRMQDRLDASLSYVPEGRDAQDWLNIQTLPGMLLRIRADIARFQHERLVLLERARLMEGR